MIRDDLFKVFRHFKIVGGQCLSPLNVFAVASKILKQYTNEQICNEINNMEADGLVIANDNSITLTDQGEMSVWGRFDLQNSIREFMNIFRHFNIQAGQILLLSNILAVKYDKLSPLSNKHFEEIVSECLQLGYFQEGDNFIILSESGHNYIYGN